MIRFIFCLAASLLPLAASAATCPGNPQALGTERVIEVDAGTTPRVGRKHFPATLALSAKEVVLTRRRALAGHHDQSFGRAEG
jgi:hypothetical protein